MSDVRPGQIWADSDPRSAGRTLRVDAIDGDRAVCTVLTNADDVQDSIDRRAPLAWGMPRDRRGTVTRIALSRFRPTSTGYRLVEDGP